MAKTSRTTYTRPADQPIVCHHVVRIRELRPYELVGGDHIYGWRPGPKTPDGFWMITKGRNASDGSEWAVRVVFDPASAKVGLTGDDLDDALYGRVARFAAQDQYLAALDVVRMVEPDELAKLRDAVLAGRVGGEADGKVAAK